MGGYRVQLPSRGSLNETFTEMPPRVRNYIRSGLTTLAKIPERDLNLLVEVILESMQSGRSPAELEMFTRFGISRDDIPTFVGAMSLLATVASTREVSAEQCVATAKDTKLIDENLASVALSFFAAVIQRRQAFQRALHVTSLSVGTLPSLIEFETVVDVRFGFEKGQISANATLIIIHINTDARGQEIWLQVTRSQLEGMIKELEEALRNAEQAEKLIAQKSTTNE